MAPPPQRRRRRPHVLVGIVTIDRDVDVAAAVQAGLLAAARGEDAGRTEPPFVLHVLAVTRDSDGATRAAWGEWGASATPAASDMTVAVGCVPHYDIGKGARHNMAAIAAKRAAVLAAARQERTWADGAVCAADALLFLDADVLPRADTLARLWRATGGDGDGHGGEEEGTAAATAADAAAAAYAVPWARGLPVVGVGTIETAPDGGVRGRDIRIVDARTLAEPLPRILFAGLGCMLLRPPCFTLPCAPVRFALGPNGNDFAEGEDLGLCCAAAATGLTIVALGDGYTVEHLYARPRAPFPPGLA